MIEDYALRHNLNVAFLAVSSSRETGWSTHIPL